MSSNVDVQEIIKNYITPSSDETQIVIVQQCDNNYWEEPTVDTTTIEFVIDDDVVKDLDGDDFNSKIAYLDPVVNNLKVSEVLQDKSLLVDNIQNKNYKINV